MKKILSQSTFSLMAIVLLLLGACKKTESENTSPPTLTGVSDLINRNTPLTSIGYGEWISIKGSNLATTYKVDFNGTLAKDSLIYGDDNTVTVKIPAQLTDPINNPITVTTKYGSATLNFQIKQPPPTITSFDPPAGNPDDIVTIVGNYFKGVTSVTINGVAATIVSSTQTEIKVKVPAGVTFGAVVVSTPVGTVTADKTFGIKYFIYDDILRNSWINSSFSTQSIDFSSTANARRGTTSIKVNHASFSAARFRLVAKFATAGYTMIKVSIFGGTGTQGKKIRVSSSNLGVTSGTYDIILNEGKWTDYQIPLANVGNPAIIEYLTFQEFSGFASPIFMDDVGFY